MDTTFCSCRCLWFSIYVVASVLVAIYLSILRISFGPVIYFYAEALRPTFSCDKLRLLSGKHFIPCFNHIPCLRVQLRGRWGNQIISLRRSLRIAELVGIEEIRIEPGQCFLMKKAMWRGILINPVAEPEKGEFGKCHSWDGFFPVSAVEFLNLTFDDDFKNIFFQAVEPAISHQLPNNSLAIHIRSGDIFAVQNAGYGGYGQPPCNFYVDIINSRNWSSVIGYAQDDKNPCVGVVKKHGGKFFGQNFKETVAELVTARNFVFGRGTIGIAVAALTLELDRLYTFNMSTGQFLAREHYNCVPTDDYYENVVMPFRSSPWQLEQMLTSRCKLWENITYDPGPRSIFIHGFSRTYVRRP